MLVQSLIVPFYLDGLSSKYLKELYAFIQRITFLASLSIVSGDMLALCDVEKKLYLFVFLVLYLRSWQGNQLGMLLSLIYKRLSLTTVDVVLPQIPKPLYGARCLFVGSVLASSA